MEFYFLGQNKSLLIAGTFARLSVRTAGSFRL
jgi:hypothetical protein